MEVHRGEVWVKTKVGEGDGGSLQTGGRCSSRKVRVERSFLSDFFMLDPPPGTGCSAYGGFGVGWGQKLGSPSVRGGEGRQNNGPPGMPPSSFPGTECDLLWSKVLWRCDWVGVSRRDSAWDIDVGPVQPQGSFWGKEKGRRGRGGDGRMGTGEMAID